MVRLALRRLVPLTGVLAALGAVAGPGAAQAASTCAAQGITITALQSGVFYIDSAVDYRGAYVGYRLTNTGATSRTGLWTRLESFAGGVVTSADGAAQTPSVPVATLAPGAASPSYHYLKASGTTSAAQRHDVVVFRGRPGAGAVEVCRETQTISAVDDVIKAAANKVTGGSVSPSTATLGGTFTLSVSGSTGTVGAGTSADPGILRFSPAVAADWPSSAFRLVAVSHQIPAPGTGVGDVLSRSNMSGADRAYTVTYTFQVVGPTAGATPVVPVQNIASGTQVKHTDPGTLGALAPIPQVTSTASITTHAGGTAPYLPGAAVPLSATVTNTGASAISLDTVVLRLPGAWAAVPGSFTQDGAALPDAYATGAELRLTGPFTVPAHGSSTFALSATAGAAGSTGTFAAVATLSGAQVDATVDPSDDQPAGTRLDVLGAPDAVDDSAAVAVGTPRSIDVLANDDPTGAAPTVTVTGAPGHGTATVEPDGHVRFVPDPGFQGTDTFTYLLTTAGGTDTATVSVDVEPLPAAPTPADVASSGTGTAAQHQDVTVPAGGAVELLDAGVPSAGTVVVPGEGTYALDAATGRITFTPVLGFAGPASPATYRVTDAYGQQATARYLPAVGAPAAPVPPARASTGEGTTPQAVTLAIPTGGSVRLLAGATPVTELTVPGEGRYSLVTATGTVTFEPVLGFAGAATPVAFRVSDAYGQDGQAAYSATVTPPAGPSAVPEASSGVGVAVQTVRPALPAAGDLSLLDGAGQPADRVEVAGEGVYVLDRATATVRFTPLLGFHGLAAGVAFRVTDPYGQHDDARYVPSVSPPLGPVAPDQGSTTITPVAQSGTLPVPEGGHLTLVDASGARVLHLDVPGVGTYDLDATTGVVQFVAAPGFTGAPPAVRYVAIDAYGQETAGSYTPSQVAAPAAEAVPAPAPAPAAARCISRRTIVVHWRVAHDVRLARVTVALDGRPVRRLGGVARRAMIDMRGRRAGSLRVTITGMTTRGRTVATTRTYHTCAARQVPAPLRTLRLR